MAGGEPRLGITWMNMHTQSATNRGRSQEQERDLHAYNPGAGRPEFVQVQLLAPIASKKLGLVIGRLADFSTQVRQNLDLLDWTTRRDVIRLMVRRIEIDDEQIEIVFRIPPLSGGQGRDHTSQSTQHCPGERRTHVWLVGTLPSSG